MYMIWMNSNCGCDKCQGVRRELKAHPEQPVWNCTNMLFTTKDQAADFAVGALANFLHEQRDVIIAVVEPGDDDSGKSILHALCVAESTSIGASTSESLAEQLHGLERRMQQMLLPAPNGVKVTKVSQWKLDYRL